jgi:ATP-binding cassette subfamily B protein
MNRFTEQEYHKNLDLRLWKDVLLQAKPFKKLMWILGIIMVLVGGLDSIFPLLTKYAIDHFIIPKQYSGITGFCALYMVILILNTVFVFLLIALAGKIETSMNNNLRKSCNQRLQELSFSYYDRTPTGWIVTRLVSDISRLGDVVAWGIVDTVWGFTMMIGITVVIFILNWKLALLVITVVPLLVFVSSKFHVTILKNYRKVRRINSMITNGFSECIHGAKTTKTLVREEANLAEFQVMNTDMYRYSVKAAVTSALFMPTVLVISAIGTGLVIWVGGNSVLIKAIGYGTFVAFISYTMQFFDPISHVARIFAELQNAQAAAERVFSLLHTEPEITDTVLFDESWSGRKMQGSVDIDNITFAYKEGKAVLKDFSLKIESGESIALVGETGTGKTTLVNLICRFYEPQSGTIRIDGTDYREAPLKWIHTNLGYVQQVPHLFQGSILENIRYGKLSATDEEIKEAARLVNAHGFIDSLPEKYDYKVGEGGNLLSTGQKQLISFARVVLANPALLILDEATASIDTETEVLVQDAIHLVLKGRTSIVVAHRLSTIRQVDRILMMHKGRIIEQGNHAHLINLRGQYYNLYMNQFVLEESEKILAQDA